MSKGPTFLPARPWGWVIRAVQMFLRFDLDRHNRVHLGARDLEVLRGLPRGAGALLAANHVSETDFKLCLDLSRRCGRRFLYLMNREAFDEGCGLAGWWLQRLGAFSVERGGRTEEAKRYAIEVVRRAQEVLVVFPEGDISYRNDLVQPFKSGVVDIGMQAVVEARRTRPDWTAHIVPMGIKYRYRQPILHALDLRVRRLEERLRLGDTGLSLRRRLALIVAALLRRQETSHHLRSGLDRPAQPGERVQEVREALLAQVEKKYAGPANTPQAQTSDRAWRLGAYLRRLVQEAGKLLRPGLAEVSEDLRALTLVTQMRSWQQDDSDAPSQERLAEMVLSLEREVLRIQRPQQPGDRDVFLRIGEPVDLGALIPGYIADAQAVRHRCAEQLRDTIQALINRK